MMWVVFVSPLSSLKLIFRFNCMGTPNWKQFDLSENKYKGVGNIYFRFEHKKDKIAPGTIYFLHTGECKRNRFVCRIRYIHDCKYCGGQDLLF